MPFLPSFLAVLAWFAYLHVLVTAANSNTTSTHLGIMSLGASVTFGVGSTTGNSYRKDLLDLLTANNNTTVEYVGTKRNGNFDNNAVEATSGFVISQIAAAADVAVPRFKPNLALLDAGTNNCNNGGTVPDAGANVTAMINNIFEQSPGATVILTTILKNSVAAQDSCRMTVNAQYSELTTKMQAAGAKLILVDMRGPAGPLVTDLADGRHPNDAGYVKMANVWFAGIEEAISKGFLMEPLKNSTVSSANSSTEATAPAAQSMTSTLTSASSSVAESISSTVLLRFTLSLLVAVAMI